MVFTSIFLVHDKNKYLIINKIYVQAITLNTDSQGLKQVTLLIFLVMKKTNVGGKGTSLYEILQVKLGGTISLSRIKLMNLFIVALCKDQTVNFERLALAFETCTKASSNLRSDV